MKPRSLSLEDSTAHLSQLLSRALQCHCIVDCSIVVECTSFVPKSGDRACIYIRIQMYTHVYMYVCTSHQNVYSKRRQLHEAHSARLNNSRFKVDNSDKKLVSNNERANTGLLAVIRG